MASPAGKYFPHADHVGSLLRPKELVEKRIAFHAGQCTAEELKALEDKTVPEIVKLQKDLGLTVLTDGEVRRYVKGYMSWCVPSPIGLRAVYNYGIFEQVEGMTVIPDRECVSLAS